MKRDRLKDPRVIKRELRKANIKLHRAYMEFNEWFARYVEHVKKEAA